MCRCRRPPTEDQSELPEFLGNVYKLHATVDQNKLDVWEFSNRDLMDADRRCFVKCSVEQKELDMISSNTRGTDTISSSNKDLIQNGKGDERKNNVKISAPIDELYLFVELTSTILLRERGELGGVAMDNEIKANLMRSSRDLKPGTNLGLSGSHDHRRSHDSSTDRKSVLKKVRTSSPSHRSGKKSSTAFDLEEELERTGNLKDDSSLDQNTGTQINSRSNLLNDTKHATVLDDLPTVEMCSGWAMIPLASTLGAMKGSTTKLKLKMTGGSPFTLIDIKKSDIPNRAGIWAAVKRAVGVQIKSELELLITPVVGSRRNAAALQDRLLTRLPANIVLPANGTTAIGLIRVLILENQISQYQGHIQNILPQSGGALLGGDAVLSSLPKLLSDPAAYRVFFQLWSLEGPKDIGLRPGETTSSNIENVNDKTKAVLRDIVLRLWRAYSSPEARPSRLDREESVDSMYRREVTLRELAGVQNPISATLRRSASKPSDILSASQLGKSATLLNPQNVEQSRGHTPFNTRELIIGEGICL